MLNADRAARTDQRTPCVLVIGGHDPAGAGIQADIETCAALDCLALTVVTALTTQNTAGVHGYRTTDPRELQRQVELLASEFPLDACKIGMVPDRHMAAALVELCDGTLRGLPLVVDPLLRAGSGAPLADDDMRAGWLDLIARASVTTPNRAEACALSGGTTVTAAAQALLAQGAAAVLVTDAASTTDSIVNLLFAAHGGAPIHYAMARFPGEYHGTGCTLASAIACGLARRLTLGTAIEQAQAFVHRAVARAHQVGARQAIPNRQAARDE